MLRILLFGCMLTACAPVVVNSDEESSTGDELTSGSGDTLTQSLTATYGLRPRHYNGFFDGSNDAERRFLAVLPAVTQFVNARAAANGYSFTITEAEIALNFISEGGYVVLTNDTTDDIDGYKALGIDTLVDNYTVLEPWLDDSVKAQVNDTTNVQEYGNEQGQMVHTLSHLSIEVGLYANAGMFAWSKALAADDLGAAQLTPACFFFWATMYYNAGSGTAHGRLTAHGASYCSVRWTQADDVNRFQRDPEFNALWRTSSMEYLSATAQLP